jgi:hypothetical protein
VDAPGEAQAVRELRELRAALAVADHHEVRQWSEPQEARGRVEEDLVRLDRRHSGDDPHERHIPEAKLCSEPPAKAFAVEEAAEVDPQRHCQELVAAADAQPQEILPNRLAHCQEPVGALRHPALDEEEEERHRWREVAVEDVAMVGMQDHGDAGQVRRQPCEGAGLCGVRVHDVGALPAHQGDQLTEGSHIRQATDRPAQDREHGQAVQGFPLQLEVVPLPGVLRPRYEEGVVAGRVQPLRERGGVQGRATDIEARDHPQHADSERRQSCHLSPVPLPGSRYLGGSAATVPRL